MTMSSFFNPKVSTSAANKLKFGSLLIICPKYLDRHVSICKGGNLFIFHINLFSFLFTVKTGGV